MEVPGALDGARLVENDGVVDLARELALGDGPRVRERVAFMDPDRFLSADIESVRELARSGALLRAAQVAVGDLR